MSLQEVHGSVTLLSFQQFKCRGWCLETIQMKMKTLEEGSEACVLMGKAARPSTGGQATQVQNLCKRTHEERLKLYCTVPYPFTQQLYKKCLCFHGKMLSLNCFVPWKLHRHKYFRATPILCLISLCTKNEVITPLILRLASIQPKLTQCRTSHYLQCGSENTSEANAEILMHHSVLLAI